MIDLLQLYNPICRIYNEFIKILKNKPKSKTVKKAEGWDYLPLAHWIIKVIKYSKTPRKKKKKPQTWTKLTEIKTTYTRLWLFETVLIMNAGLFVPSHLPESWRCQLHCLRCRDDVTFFPRPSPKQHRKCTSIAATTADCDSHTSLYLKFGDGGTSHSSWEKLGFFFFALIV